MTTPLHPLRVAIVLMLVLSCGTPGCDSDGDPRTGDASVDLPGDLPGDPAPTTPLCTHLDAPVIAACVTRMDATAPESGLGMEHDLEGSVDKVIDGRRADGCIARYWHIVGGRAEDAANEHTILLTDDDGVQWAVEVALPGAPRPPVGQRVTVDVFVGEQYFSPLEGHVDVRITDGRRLWWIGQGGTVDALEAPEGIRFQRHDAVCGGSFEHCGAWLGYDVVAVQGERTIDVPYGDTATFGALHILHGRVELQTETTTPCADWHHAVAILAVTWDAP